MASFPGIIIKIGANTRDAVQGLNRVDKALGRTRTAGQRMSAVIDKVGPALGVAAAAAGAFAVKLGVDAVQAAIDDEKSVATLNKTLENLGVGFKSIEVDGFVSNLQKLYGVADSDLRPAFDRLVRSTKDVGDAERALQTALDVSIGTGKDLLTVADSIGAAYDGNKTKLQRLGIGLDKAWLQSADLNDIMGKLGDTFGGQAAANAETLSGRIDRVTEAAGEASEAVGGALLDAITGMTEDTDAAVDQISDFGDELAATVTVIGEATAAVGDFAGAVAESAGAGEAQYGAWERILALGGPVGSLLANLTKTQEDEAAAAAAAAAAQQAVTQRYQAMADAANRAARGIKAVTQAREDDAIAASWNSGYATQREQANENYRRGRQRAAAKRAAEKRQQRRQAKKERRAEAVREARAAELARKRAQARTGQNFGAVKSTPGQRACS